LADGRPAVMTERFVNLDEIDDIDQALRTVKTARQLAAQGDFANVIATGFRKYPNSNTGRLQIIMEHMGYSRSGLPVIAAGDGDRSLSAIRSQPIGIRQTVRNRMLELLRLHPDGHPLNVRW